MSSSNLIVSYVATTGKRRLTGEQLVEHCTDSIDICDTADSGVVSHGLFRRHVTGRAQYIQSVRDAAFGFQQAR